MQPFFDQQEPFKGAPDGESAAGCENVNFSAMQFLQQAWQMQLQLMQSLCMMPWYMMQNMMAMMTMMGGNAGDRQPEEKPASGGFKLGNMDVPPELLGMLLRMDMSPENLEKLQKVLDFVFEVMPRANRKTGD